MDWYKHSTGSHDDPDISDAIDEFGHAGYAVFFMTLEIYGEEYNHLDEGGWLTLTKKFLERKYRLAWLKRGRTLEQCWSSRGVDKGKLRSYSGVILEFFRSRGRFEIIDTPETISIKIPKFLEIASNWTKRKTPVPTEALCRASVVPTAIEEEEEEEKEKKKEITTLAVDESPTCPHEEILSLYHKILPELAVVKVWTPTRQSHLRSRWKESKERQNLQWWEGYFKKVKSSPFLTGNVTDFKADMEWIIKQANMVKIIEGKYDGGRNGKGIRTNRSDPGDKTLQSRTDANLAAIWAERDAAKAAATDKARGISGSDDAPHFESGRT